MYAIVEIAGKQFKVTQDQFVYAPRMQGEEGASVEFDKVLLVDNDGQVEVGAPLLTGVKVSGKILGHVKGDKVIVFKKKRRKGYKKKNGHRQDFTKIQIAGIVTGGKSKSAAKKSTEPKEEKKPATKKTKGDDLTTISGIGPVFAEELTKIGYTTFAQIAALKKEEIHEIAEKIDGVSEELVTNEEWKKQAKELMKGETDKETTPSKKKVADDLTEITGIGPVFAKELGKLGYKSFDQIASLTKTQISEIAEKIDGISEDLVQNEEWIKQAKALKKK